MAEMGVWAGIAAGDAEGPLWVDCVEKRLQYCDIIS
jgi:hypothetical protein